MHQKSCAGEDNERSVKGRCGARTRSGNLCQNWPTRYNGQRCRMHGGAPGCGRPLVHGRYSKVLRGGVRDKLETFLLDPDYQSVAEELALQRALLAQHLEDLEGRVLTVEDTGRLLSWLTQITMTGERVSRIKLRTALTAAEVQFLEVAIVSVLHQMLGPEQAAEFRRRLGELLGGPVINQNLLGADVFQH